MTPIKVRIGKNTSAAEATKQIWFITEQIRELCKDDKDVMVEISEYSPKRSISANDLYWKWLTDMAYHFNAKSPKDNYSKDDMHDLMRHKFLGYFPEKKLGQTIIPPSLKSTRDLSKGDMCHYLNQIDMWAASVGCLLPRPEDSDYEEYLKIHG